MDARTLYEDLMKEIATDEAALAKKREVASFIFSRLEDTVQRYTPHSKGDDLMPSLADRKTLSQHVSEAVETLGGVEFVVGDVYEILTNKAIDLPEQPKSKITTVLSRLAERGELVQTFKGSGNVPNRYRKNVAGVVEGSTDATDLL